MDLKFLLRVVRRRWLTILFGLVVATTAAVLAGWKVTDSGLKSRAVPSFEATSRVLVVVPDRSIIARGAPVPTTPDGKQITTAGGYGPDQLAEIYAFIVVSDDLRTLIEAQHGPFVSGDDISASRRHTGPDQPDDPETSSILPVLEITAKSRTAEGARSLAVDASLALTSYISNQQAIQNVAPEFRVQLQTLELPSGAKDNTGKNTGTVALVFAAIFGAFVALAFGRENSARTAVAGGDPTRWINVVVPIDTTLVAAGLPAPSPPAPAAAPTPGALDAAPDSPNGSVGVVAEGDGSAAPAEPRTESVVITPNLEQQTVAEAEVEEAWAAAEPEPEVHWVEPVVPESVVASREATRTRNAAERTKPRRRWPRHRTR